MCKLPEKTNEHEHEAYCLFVSRVRGGGTPVS